MTKKPTVSVIIATYNRAGLIERSIESLFKQSFKDFEIIVVDDGSTDNTEEVLLPHKDKIRYYRHKTNKGVCAAKNTGLDQIKGEWFTFLDDDDELLPNTLEELLNVPKEIDPAIDAVTCNCIDTMTGEFSGQGLYKSGYITLGDIVGRCSGEFWGITKTRLLGNMRFNDELPGVGNVLWYRIDEIANRYYIHQGLRIYHTEGNDHVTVKLKSIKKKIRYYQVLADDDFYWDVLCKYNLSKFKKECFKGKYFLALDGIKGLNPYSSKLKNAQLPMSLTDSVVNWLPDLFGPKTLKTFYGFFKVIKNGFAK